MLWFYSLLVKETQTFVNWSSSQCADCNPLMWLKVFFSPAFSVSCKLVFGASILIRFRSCSYLWKVGNSPGVNKSMSPVGTMHDLHLISATRIPLFTSHGENTGWLRTEVCWANWLNHLHHSAVCSHFCSRCSLMGINRSIQSLTQGAYSHRSIHRPLLCRGGGVALPTEPCPHLPWMRISLLRHDLLGEEKWPISQRRRALSQFLNGLLWGLICIRMQGIYM